MIQVRTLRNKQKRYDVRLRDPAGNAYTKTFRTRKAAESFVAQQAVDHDRGSWIDPRLAQQLFRDVAAEWLESNPAKRPSTKTRDAGVVHNKLNPQIGNVRIGSVTPELIQRLVNDWSEHLQPRTVVREYGVIKAIFNFAVERDYLGRSPCRRIRLPRPNPLDRPKLRPADITRIAEAMPPQYELVPYLGAVLGLRWGEIFGLRIGRLELETGTAHIVEQKGRERTEFGPPKSNAGRRTLAIPEPLVEMIRSHINTHVADPANPQALLFVAPEGGPVQYGHFRTRVWIPACARAGLPDARPHDLRRANATVMVTSGVDIKTVQSRLGQTDPRLAIAIYAQQTTDADVAAAERLGRAFFGTDDPEIPRTIRPSERPAREIRAIKPREERAMEPEIEL